MLDGKRILCLVPARGGSTGLPGKNIRPIGGIPMIGHAITKALAVEQIDDVVVSTDSPEIARVAAGFGAEIPFLRPAELARSETPMVPVVLHALDALEAAGRKFDILVALQANSPLLTEAQIREVLRAICGGGLDVAFTVTEAGHPPQWTLRLEGRDPSFAFEACQSTKGDSRQEQSTLYRSTGAVWACDIAYLRANASTARLCLPAPGQRAAAIRTDPLTAVDIDDEIDFLLAEAIFARAKGAQP